MNHPDDAIDRLLSGLRNIPVSQSLDRRILDALEDCAARRTLQRRFGRLAWASAAACAFIAVGAAALFIALSPAKHQNPATSGPPTSALQSQENIADSEASVTSPAAPVPLAIKRPSPRLRRTTSVTSSRTGAREPDHVNLPPPPLPLTREERLLLEIGHRRSAFELAMLTSVRNAAQEQREHNEFDQFFALSKTQHEIEKLNSSQPNEEGKQ